MRVQAAEAGRAVRAGPACTQAPRPQLTCLALSALRGVTVQQLWMQGSDLAYLMMCAALLATMSSDVAVCTATVHRVMIGMLEG